MVATKDCGLSNRLANSVCVSCAAFRRAVSIAASALCRRVPPERATAASTMTAVENRSVCRSGDLLEVIGEVDKWVTKVCFDNEAAWPWTAVTKRTIRDSDILEIIMAALRHYRALVEHGIDDRLLALERLSELTGSLGHQLLETKRVLAEACEEVADLQRRAVKPPKGEARIMGDHPRSGPATEGLITLAEIANELGVARQSIWKLRRSGRFPEPVRVTAGRRLIRFRRSDIEAWMQDFGKQE